jgi:hypothetical protein
MLPPSSCFVYEQVNAQPHKNSFGCKLLYKTLNNKKFNLEISVDQGPML